MNERWMKDSKSDSKIKMEKNGERNVMIFHRLELLLLGSGLLGGSLLWGSSGGGLLGSLLGGGLSGSLLDGL